MKSQFIGKGWKFPVTPDAACELDSLGQALDCPVAMVAEEQLISQSIEIILRTARGERLMRPNFGCGINELVFQPNNATTTSRVTQAVREALLEWEPRIDVLDVQTMVSRDEANVLLITIEYRVRTTNNVFNKVYPFYLNQGT